jgi:hypothetical protein
MSPDPAPVAYSEWGTKRCPWCGKVRATEWDNKQYLSKLAAAGTDAAEQAKAHEWAKTWCWSPFSTVAGTCMASADMDAALIKMRQERDVLVRALRQIANLRFTWSSAGDIPGPFDIQMEAIAHRALGAIGEK